MLSQLQDRRLQGGLQDYGSSGLRVCRLRGCAGVEELLRLPSVEWNRPREAPYPVVRDVSEADRAARSLRDHWSLGSDPVPDLFELLEEQGIKVTALEDE